MAPVMWGSHADETDCQGTVLRPRAKPDLHVRLSALVAVSLCRRRPNAATRPLHSVNGFVPKALIWRKQLDL